jgi:hypothetical protein
VPFARPQAWEDLVPSVGKCLRTYWTSCRILLLPVLAAAIVRVWTKKAG